jgi:chromatin structure-remodeling complex subunit SFH1
MQHNTGNVPGAAGGPSQREGKPSFTSCKYQLNNQYFISASSNWQSSQQMKPNLQKPRTSNMHPGMVPHMKQPGGSAGHFIPQPVSHRVVIPPVPQALLSSYASRLRTGTTLLVQPISTPGQAPAPGTAPPTGNYTPVAAATAASRATRGRTSTVNYTEAGSGDEFEEPPEKPMQAGAVDSDDSDFQASGGTRTMVRRMGRGPGSSAVLNAKLTNAVSANKEHSELDKSHLGSVPPLNFLRPLMVHNFKVEHQSV